jgi:hypothetical protein
MRVGLRCWSLRSESNSNFDVHGCSVINPSKVPDFFNSTINSLRETLGSPPGDLKGFVSSNIINSDILPDISTA